MAWVQVEYPGTGIGGKDGVTRVVVVGNWDKRMIHRFRAGALMSHGPMNGLP